MTVTNAITPDSIRVYFTTLVQNATNRAKCAIYANGTDAPAALLGYTEERYYKNMYVNRWSKFNFVTPPTLTAGDYWIAIWANNGFSATRGGAVTGAKNWGYKSTTYAADFPATIDTPTLQTFADRDVHVAITQDDTWEILLASEPTKVYFNNVEGTKKTSIAAVNEEYAWYYAAGVLYVYSENHADIGYQITYE